MYLYVENALYRFIRCHQIAVTNGNPKARSKKKTHRSVYIHLLYC